jgi:hypothetical protein
MDISVFLSLTTTITVLGIITPKRRDTTSSEYYGEERHLSQNLSPTGKNAVSRQNNQPMFGYKAKAERDAKNTKGLLKSTSHEAAALRKSGKFNSLLLRYYGLYIMN